MKWINRLYIIFVGILLAMTTGFGVAAFYPEPVRPIYPVSKARLVPESCYKTPDAARSDECQRIIDENQKIQNEEQIKFEEKSREFENENAGYTRTAIFLGVAVGSIFAVLGLSIIKKSRLVANGLLLGAVLTSILTRFLIMLASFGPSARGTGQINMVSFVEFGILVILSIGIVIIGFKTLSDEPQKV